MSPASDPPNTPLAPRADQAFVGGGKMGELIRAKDWSRTPLGPIESWSPSLRTAVSLVLNSNFPISLAWGPQHIQIYNDGYWPICGEKHPTAMGQDFSECWASAFPVIGDIFRSALAGKAAYVENSRMFLDRLGYLEETFFTFSFSPIRDEYGAVAGLFHPATETTGNMLSQRRTKLLRDLTAIGLRVDSFDDALRRCALVLAEAAFDLPFALFYGFDEDGRTARLVAQVGLAPGGVASPASVELTSDTAAWPLAKIGPGDKALAMDDLHARFPELVCGPYPEPIAAARLLPIAPPGGERALGIMVLGVSTRLPLDEAYASFHELLGTTVGNVVARALATQTERQRAVALTEIDRAKTAFFANISHEFRTPLTLMLGPLEDELAERTAPLPAPRRERIEAAHRNSLRLLKLVNTLLDFSRIEAGRARASFQPTDLAAYTAELASAFRSALEKAGLALTVDCPALPKLLWVDRDMWEKVVLNLLSNALKHTFTGGVRVALSWAGDHVELEITDTGIGIPAADLPHLFERFHQVRGALSRTHEGTGIGLALVQDVARLHGGTVRVSSEEGKGSTFTVTLKTGHAHLADEQIAATATPLAPASRAPAYVAEAMQWIVASPAVAAPAAPPAGAPRERIVWADDNADMRDYVRRLLAEHYAVIAVSNGREAVAAAMSDPPDLVLTDIMMPGLDGYGVLRELRANERTRAVPVILLSARAGEESLVDGLTEGADDYLVKPFATRELLARVRMHLDLTRLRREWAAEQARATALEHDAEESQRVLAAATQSRRALLGILEDLQRTETELSKSEIRYRTLFDQIDEGFCIIEMIFDKDEKPIDYRFLEINPSFEKQTGLVGARGKRMRELAPLHEQHWFEIYGKIALSGEPARFVNRAEQLHRWYDVYAFRFGQPQDRQVAILFNDITTRQHAESEIRRLHEELQGHAAELEQRVAERTVELEAAKLRAESADRVKSAFLATMSHELRTPLNSIIGFTGILQQKLPGPLNAEQEKQLGIVRNASRHLLALINDVLDISKVEAGELSLARDQFDLRALVERLGTTFAPEAARRGLTFDLDIGEGDYIITNDARRVEQVLNNLLSNALKFTPRGSIKLSCSYAENSYPIVVYDTGIGIRDTDLDKLFRPFSQIETGLPDLHEGTGLGLAISMHLAQAMGAGLTVESEWGQGSRFCLKLPEGGKA